MVLTSQEKDLHNVNLVLLAIIVHLGQLNLLNALLVFSVLKIPFHQSNAQMADMVILLN